MGRMSGWMLGKGGKVWKDKKEKGREGGGWGINKRKKIVRKGDMEEK